MPALPPAPRQTKAVAYFQGISVLRFEDGARVEKEGISFPPNGLIEACGLGVVTWRVRRAPDSRSAEVWINYHLESGKYELVKLPLHQKVAPGAELKFDTDLKQHAPKGWTGRCRIRLIGAAAEIMANASFQIY